MADPISKIMILDIMRYFMLKREKAVPLRLNVSWMNGRELIGTVRTMVVLHTQIRGEKQFRPK